MLQFHRVVLFLMFCHFFMIAYYIFVLREATAVQRPRPRGPPGPAHRRA